MVNHTVTGSGAGSGITGDCKTFSQRNKAAGITRIACPSGYQMTGGGMYNHYRKFNTKSSFEESMPEGNGWRCDTGFGLGDNTCYVRCCK